MTGRMDVSVGCRQRNWCLLSCLSPCRRSSWVCRAHCGLSGRAGSGAIEGAVGFLLLGRGYGDTLTGRDPANTHPYGGLNESRRWSWPPYLCGLDVHCPPKRDTNGIQVLGVSLVHNSFSLRFCFVFLVTLILAVKIRTGHPTCGGLSEGPGTTFPGGEM